LKMKGDVWENKSSISKVILRTHIFLQCALNEAIYLL
jgi:hypothetical protein